MSETKDTEAGEEAQAKGESAVDETAQLDAEPAEPADAESRDDRDAGPAVDEAGAALAPKKKKKKREPVEPESIRDRNARVRAEAAEKRRSRREREQGASPRRNLDASEVMDDALARSTHVAANFLTRHFNKVQWLIMAGLVGWIGFEVYTWRHAQTSEKATDRLFKALSAELGKVGGDEPEAGEERGLPSDTRRSFASDEERLKAAKTEYLAASAGASEAAAMLADLGAAGIAYDLGQYKDAQASYQKVQQHSSFEKDSEVKGRTLEGLGLSLEAQKDEDGALKQFRQLSNLDGVAFSALGLYHQARILKGQGKSDDALKLLEKAGSKLEALKETPGAIKYLGGALIELMESIDAVKARALSQKLMSSEMLKKMTEGAGAGPGAANASKISAEMQKKIQELMQKQQATPAPGQPAPLPGPVAPPVQDAPQDAPPSDAPAPAPSGAP